MAQKSPMLFIIYCNWNIQPEEKVNDLYSADDRKASEESHGASNEAQLCLRLDLLVSFDLVKGGCVKIDFYQLQGWLELIPWKNVSLLLLKN